MRIARITRLGALYGASISAGTFDEVGQVVLKPIDFREVIDVHITNAVGGIQFAHMEDMIHFWRRNQKMRTYVIFLRK